MKKRPEPASSLRLNARLAAGVAMTMAVGNALAFPIGTDNPDLTINWDNTIRYNLGVRAKDCDPNICGNGAGAGDFLRQESDRKFAKAGDIVANRVDLLSEFDASYKRTFGVRVSASGWYDNAYRGGVESDPAFMAAGLNGAGVAGSTSYSDSTKRWNRGLSGEFLDAFVFGKVDLGDVPVNLKLGQHNVFWGESFFNFVNGVAYDQGPVDVRKAVANPGSEAKELFKPLNQLSFSADLTDRLTLAGQYVFDWKPSPLPDGGTYFGLVDAASMGGGGTATIPVAPGVFLPVAFGGVTGQPDKKQGDWGLAARWRPEWLDGTVGFYYRDYSEKFPQLVLSQLAMTPNGPAPSQFGLDYSTPRAKLYGLSLAKSVGDVSVGADLTYREGAMLMTPPFAVAAGQANLGGGPVGNSLLPTGNIVAGVVNALAALPRSGIYDSAILIGELSFTHLASVKTNAANFAGAGYDCAAESTGFAWGCATKNSTGVSVLFSPKWYQVRSGIDLEMPVFIGYGIHGNSAIPLAEMQGMGTYSLGLTADVDNKYNISLKYNGFIVKHENDSAGAASLVNSGIGAKWWDRDFVSLTVKATF